jgi:broad specificity phosphatase PhoE
MTVLLARHGETDSNAERRFQGQLDTPLNARGREQAVDLAERVATEVPDLAVLVASPLSRARETAEIVGRRVGLEPRLDPRFMEIHVGEWQGLLYSEVLERDPELMRQWMEPPPGFRFPGGESIAEQQARVREGLDAVRAEGRLPALVVCHGGVIRAALADATGSRVTSWAERPIENGSLFRL